MTSLARCAIRRGNEKFTMTGLSIYTTPVGRSNLITIRDVKHGIHLRLDTAEARTIAALITTEADEAERLNQEGEATVDWKEEAEKWKRRSRLWEGRHKAARAAQPPKPEPVEEVTVDECQRLEEETALIEAAEQPDNREVE